jgi:hypothetical protein
MSGSTPELNLKTAVDSDDTADYLTLSLAQSLQTVDALYNNVTGHTHSGAHQGGPITSIPIGAIADGAITSAKIADGTITGLDLADGAVTTAKIAAGAVSVAAYNNFGQLTTNSMTYISFLSGAITLDMGPTGGNILVVLFATGRYESTGERIQFGIQLDAGSIQDCARNETLSADYHVTGGVALFGAGAGSHTITPKVHSMNGASVRCDSGYMIAWGLKR